MATKFERRPTGAPETTHVQDMPPLNVITEGIPDREHVTAPMTAETEPVSATREERMTMLAWALAGLLGLLILLGGVLGITRLLGEDALHMGLTTQAWQDYRAGERAVAPSLLAGLGPQAWQELRAGERAGVLAQPSTWHMGLAPAAWQDYRTGERIA